MKWEYIFSTIIGVITMLIGGWSLALQILLVLMCVDIISGIIKSLKNNSYSSRQFRQGLFVKSGFFAVLILCYQVDLLLSNGVPVIRNICVLFYIAIEGSSIIENLGAMGVPIPTILVKKFQVLKEQAEQESVKQESKDNLNK